MTKPTPTEELAQWLEVKAAIGIKKFQEAATRLRELSVENQRLRESLVAAERLCRIYFEIAESAVGTDSLRAQRDRKLDAILVEEPSDAE